LAARDRVRPRRSHGDGERILSGCAGAGRNSCGVFFREQSTDSLVEAIRVFEAAESRFSPFFISQQAERFDEAHFKEKFGQFVSEKLEESQYPNLSL
jgi:hypothetical protein